MGTGINWTEKYRPKKIAELIGITEQVAMILKYIKQFLKLREDYLAYVSQKKQEQIDHPTEEIKITEWKDWKGVKALLLIGTPGIGKTTIVQVIASELIYDLITLNTSDVRNKAGLEQKLGITIKNQTLTKFFGQRKSNGRMILMDEADGISGNEQSGGFKTLCDLIQNSQHPMILTANTHIDSFDSFTEYVTIINMPMPTPENLTELLTRIVIAEKLTYQDQDLVYLALISQNDYRSVINNLQMSIKDQTVICQKSNMQRDRALNEQDGLLEYFNTGSIEQTKQIIKAIDLDQKDLIRWIHENVISLGFSPVELLPMLEALLQADKLNGLIGETQYWGLYGYVFDELATIPTYRINQTDITHQFKPPTFMNYNPIYSAILRGLQTIFPLSLVEIYYYVVPLLKILFSKYPSLQMEVFAQARLLHGSPEEYTNQLLTLQKQWSYLK